MNTPVAPDAMAAETIAVLEANADETKARANQRWFKDPVDSFGNDNELVKELKLELIAKVDQGWTIAEAVQFCEAMVRDPHMEARGIGYQVVAHFAASADASLFATARRWLEETCGNWGLVDNLAPSVVAPVVQRHPHLIPDLIAWTGSPNLWLRRGAVVTFVPLVGDEDFREAAYEVAGRLLDDTEDLIHKAVGWLLREAGKRDPDRLIGFLLKNGAAIPRTTVRYAIERFPKDERKRLLLETRKKLACAAAAVPL
jgi:3-methyladenine DNA glycosylase AlkD